MAFIQILFKKKNNNRVRVRIKVKDNVTKWMLENVKIFILSHYKVMLIISVKPICADIPSRCQTLTSPAKKQIRNMR